MYDHIKLSIFLSFDYELTKMEYESLKEDTFYKIRNISKKYDCLQTGSNSYNTSNFSMYLSIPKYNTRGFLNEFKRPLKVKSLIYYYDITQNFCNCFGSKKYNKKWVKDISYHYVNIYCELYQ